MPEGTCSKCGAPVMSRGLCNRHYRKALHAGELPRERGWPHPVPARRRFWAKVDKESQAPCWTWTGAAGPDGYGRFSTSPEDKWVAHRLAYEWLVGPIPDGLQLDHLCRNRTCVNPDHLEPVTQRENLRRGNGWAGLNARKTHCAAGHEYTPENTYVNPGNGDRKCRTCMRAADRARRPPGTQRKKAAV